MGGRYWPMVAMSTLARRQSAMSSSTCSGVSPRPTMIPLLVRMSGACRSRNAAAAASSAMLWP